MENNDIVECPNCNGLSASLKNDMICDVCYCQGKMHWLKLLFEDNRSLYNMRVYQIKHTRKYFLNLLIGYNIYKLSETIYKDFYPNKFSILTKRLVRGKKYLLQINAKNLELKTSLGRDLIIMDAYMAFKAEVNKEGIITNMKLEGKESLCGYFVYSH